MNFLELQNMALGDDFEPTTRRESAKAFINQALGRASRSAGVIGDDARAIVSTQVGVNAYALPGDFGRLVGDDGLFLDTTPLMPVDVSALDQTTSMPGTPQAWAFAESVVIVHPTPDSVVDLQLRYKAVQQLAGDAEVPKLPGDWHPHLAMYARAKLYLLTDDSGMHDAIIATLPRVLQTDVLAGPRVPQTRRVPGTWSRLASTPRFRHPQGLF